MHVVKITHPGIETLVTEDGRRVRVHHNDVTAQCTYKATTGVFTGDGALDADHTMIGPFCQWILEIPEAANRSLDLTGLASIKVEFQGTYRAFVPAGGA